MSSEEYAQWVAWHRATGGLSDEWKTEALASIHELLQFQAYLTGQAHFTDKHHKKGPAPKPELYARPGNPARPTSGESDDDEWVQPPLGEEEDEEA
ncbi:hypothetical protein [Streptomyces griseus]|uniref:hypothetical protein n=1 Tax=Streptomyces griseus TaxID=1911 RepID=UPI0033C10290